MEINFGPYKGNWGTADAIPIVGTLIHGLRPVNFEINKYNKPMRNYFSCTADAAILGAYNGALLLGTSLLIHNLYF
ncbi:MAG: hypothetical protein HY831_01865 [Candidatus Aenigmarchaeota archaeon]|nr:hypothetical protein [Candidatus Aenigmarchaeota archaeon]